VRPGRVVVWVDYDECGPVVADHEDMLMACHRFSRQARYPDILCLDRGHKTILAEPYGNVRNRSAGYAALRQYRVHKILRRPSARPGGAILLIEPDFLPVSVAEPAGIRAFWDGWLSWSRE
jgi:hypothetical protein